MIRNSNLPRVCNCIFTFEESSNLTKLVSEVSLYHSPLPFLASRLLQDQPVRVFSTFTMGADQDHTIHRNWHADFPVFTGN